MVELERQFYSAGYFLVEPASRPPYSDSALLPEFVVSISPHICDLHPPISILSWVKEWDFSIDDYRRKLNVTDEVFLQAMETSDLYFNNLQFGWNSIFYEKEKALAFFQDYLKNVVKMKLFQALIPLEFSSTLINEMSEETLTPHGMETPLKSSDLILMKDSELIGYEVICYDVCEFHSFLCNSLETVFLEKLNIHLNQCGLISSLEDAIRASAFCNSEESGAELGYWLPCGLLETPLSKIEVNAHA